MTMQVVFRADGGADVGAGHIQRCRALAQALVLSGSNCLFASTPESQTLLPEDACRQFTWTDVQPDADAQAVGRSVSRLVDWLVVDHYGLDAKFEQSARAWAKRIMVIDDVPGRQHDCDLLLDQNQTNEKAWRNLVPPMAAVLAGPRYALLRREVSDVIAARGARQSRVVLVFGASDPHSMTERLLPSVVEALPDSWTLDVVAGPANTRHETLRAMCASLGAEFHHAPRDIVAIFAQSRIAITAGGSTCWELCALGVPILVVVDSNNQEGVAFTVTSAGAGVPFRGSDADMAQKLARSVRELVADPERQKRMGQVGRSLVDGQGPRRVVDAMLAKAQKEVAT